MEYDTNTEGYRNPVISFYENIPGDQFVIQDIKAFTCVVDFVFEESFETDGKRQEAGSWRMSERAGPERKIKNAGIHNGHIFSIALQENPYLTYPKSRVQKDGWFTTVMAYPILKLISLIHTREPEADYFLWIRFYSEMLLNYLAERPVKKSNCRFSELMAIYQSVEQLSAITSDFPNASSLIRSSGIPINRFQKGCQGLYGQPVQKIIQHLKMKRGFEEILTNHQSIRSTSLALGYDHSENFITAFHRHFALTPGQAAQIYPR